MRIALWCTAGVLSITLLMPALAQDKDQKPGGGQNMEEMMKKWKETMAPGAPHAMLAEMAGSWDMETRTWMNGPKSEPSVTKGSADFEMVLGGRFLQQKMTGEMMGMPMNGVGLTGYDNFKQKFIGSWVDNTSTALYTMEGTLDKEKKTITYWGVMDDPMTGKKDNKVKYVEVFVDKDKHIFRIYDVGAGGEDQPSVEMTYTRKK